MQQTEAIVMLDVGNVLFTFLPWPERITRIVRAYGGQEGCETWFSGMWGRSLMGAVESGSMSQRQLWKYVCRKSGISHHRLPEQLFAGLYAQHLQPILGAIEIAQQVQKQHPLVAVSDGDLGSRYALDLLTMPPYNMQFLETYVSCERHVRKPLLYAYAMQDLWNKHGITVDRYVCVDNISSYVDFVRDFGGRGISFNGSQEPAEMLWWRLQGEGINSQSALQ